MIKQTLQVDEFQVAASNIIPSVPTLGTKERIALGHRLLMEEVDEYLEADSLHEQADAMIDVIYLAIGELIQLGLGDRVEQLFDEVHKSNMSKVVDGKLQKNDIGKVLKPDTYFKPDLKSIVEMEIGVSTKSGLKDVLEKIGKNRQNKFNQNIDKKIMSMLDDKGKSKFSDYQKLEKFLKKKVDVKVKSNSTSKYAEITINDKTEVVFE